MKPFFVLRLKRACFRRAVPGVFDFAHKTYGEFLAARYLSTMKMPEAQLESLLSLMDRTPPQYVPQLHEVVAWLASFDDAVFERVMAREPEILLAADLPAEDGATRARIVDAILARTQAGAISYDRRRDLATQLNRLNHGDLAAQLTVPLRLRALSSLGLRVDAGYAVCRLNMAGANARLKPLAFSSPTDDPSDELRGLGMRATWPDTMTASELFNALRPPLRSNFSGSYSGFFRSQRIAEQLAPGDLPEALTWVAQQQLDDDFWRPLSRVWGEIVTRVFREGDTTLLRQLAPIVYRAYHDFRCPFFAEPGEETFGSSNDTTAVNRLIEGNVEARRILISEIVQAMPADTTFHLLAHSDCPLARESDFVWLLERSCSATGDESVAWAKLARRVMSWTGTEHLDAWLEMSARCPAVAAVLDYPRVIEIESVDGRRAKGGAPERTETTSTGDPGPYRTRGPSGTHQSCRLAGSIVVLALICLAILFSCAGSIIRSFVATTYHVGLLRHAAIAGFASKIEPAVFSCAATSLAFSGAVRS
jgi:hypothetical protein